MCVASDYKHLMIGGQEQDDRLGWFVRDVLFPLAHTLQIMGPLPAALLTKTVQLQNEIARCLVDFSTRLPANLNTKKTISLLCCMSLLDNPQRFINVPVNLQQRAL